MSLPLNRYLPKMDLSTLLHFFFRYTTHPTSTPQRSLILKASSELVFVWFLVLLMSLSMRHNWPAPTPPSFSQDIQHDSML